MLKIEQKPQEVKFELGRVLVSAEAKVCLTDHDLFKALSLHERGDWGMLCPKDWQLNDEALQSGSGLLSVYQSAKDEKFFVLTDPDRRTTYVILPQEY